MRRPLFLKRVWLWSLMGLVSSCVSKPVDAPARLANIDAATMRRVSDTLKASTRNQNIVLGPQSLEAPTITVLPPPLGVYETRSVAVPEIYDIIKRGEACLLKRRSSGVVYLMTGVECVAVVTAQK